MTDLISIFILLAIPCLIVFVGKNDTLTKEWIVLGKSAFPAGDDKIYRIQIEGRREFVITKELWGSLSINDTVIEKVQTLRFGRYHLPKSSSFSLKQ